MGAGAGIGANFLWGPAIGAACGITAGIIKKNNRNSNFADSLDRAGRQISQNTSLSTPIHGGNSTISNNIQNSSLSIGPDPLLAPVSPISNSNSKPNVIFKISSNSNNNKSIRIKPKISSKISKTSLNSINKPIISLKKKKSNIKEISSNNMKPAIPAFNSNSNNNDINNKINKKYNLTNFNSFKNTSIYEDKLKDLCYNQKQSNSTNFSSKFNNNNSI